MNSLTGILILLLLIQGTVCVTWFKPLSEQCLDIDTIDHCCSCRGGFSERFDATPLSAPVPRAGENLGTSLQFTGDGTRIIADNFPDTEDDQRIDDNTLVHVIELDDVHEIAHYTIGSDFEEDSTTTPLPSKGHTLACSDDLILFGSPSTYPATAALYVRTSNPPWSLSVFLKEPTENSEFGYAVAVEENTQQMAVSDPSQGFVYVYLTYADFILDTVRQPGVPVQGSRFGHAVVMQNYTMVVSSPFDGDGTIHVFYLQDSRWQYAQTLNAPLPTSAGAFGWRIAIDGDYLVVGSKHASKVEVFRKTVVYDHIQTLTAPGMTLVSRFGWGLDVKHYDGGLRIAVGDPMFLSSVSAHGKVFLYEYDGSVFQQCETFYDDKTSFHTRFGATVALSRTGLMTVAAPDTDSKDNGRGRLWLFDLRREKQCAGCDGVINSLANDDGCGVCGGDNSTCAGCDGVPYSGKRADECGVCEGDNSACLRINTVRGLSGLETFAIDSKEDETTVSITAQSATANALITTTVFYELPDVCNRIETSIVMEHAPRQTPVRWSVLEEPTHCELALGSRGEGLLNATLPLSQIRNSPADDRFVLRVEDELAHVVEVHVSFSIRACLGCDDVLDSGKVEDTCGVCGGDGSSCHDCAGYPEGLHSVDACGACTLPEDANHSCLEIVTLSDQTIYCHQTVELSDAPVYSPTYEGQQIRWHIVDEPTHGACSIGYRTGLLTYHHRGKENSHETITFVGSDRYGNEAQSTVAFHVIGCDVVGCDGVMGSGKIIDRCHVCGGGDECVDCYGDVHGSASLDQCGVCGGDGSSCDIIAAGEDFIIEGDPIEVDVRQDAAATVAGVPIVILALVALVITIVGVGFVWLLYSGRRDRKEYANQGRSQWTDTQRWNYNAFGNGARPPL